MVGNGLIQEDGEKAGNGREGGGVGNGINENGGKGGNGINQEGDKGHGKKEGHGAGNGKKAER